LQKLSSQDKRKRLEEKIIQIFQEEMENLSADLQEILADDLVTAFLNRLTVFTEIQSKTEISTPRTHSLNP